MLVDSQSVAVFHWSFWLPNFQGSFGPSITLPMYLLRLLAPWIHIEGVLLFEGFIKRELGDVVTLLCLERGMGHFMYV